MEHIYIAAILVIIGINALAADWNDPIQFLLEADKDVYQKGENIFITCKFINQKGTPVKLFFSWFLPNHIDSANFIVYGPLGRIFDRITINPPDPVRESFVDLLPNQQVSQRYPINMGYFEFKYLGEYRISAVYSTKYVENNYFDLSNWGCWIGTIYSDTITVTVEEPKEVSSKSWQDIKLLIP